MHEFKEMKLLTNSTTSGNLTYYVTSIAIKKVSPRQQTNQSINQEKPESAVPLTTTTVRCCTTFASETFRVWTLKCSLSMLKFK
jgi:hypothetical protein